MKSNDYKEIKLSNWHKIYSWMNLQLIRVFETQRAEGCIDVLILLNLIFIKFINYAGRLLIRT